ncbi:permease-like cell division protein FtsX [Microbispora sp. H11081]|uniref:permease-like cell division protein FtsX n=1 Tax=Microbispora sp. H11081 TaxID=2729107 RepID=UPI0014764108|nr:permease-like cell division protein FtsX [Microbispora sp. H11081]
MSTIEDRLRDAMAARARTVPDDGLDHALPAPRGTRTRGLAIAAAALAVVGTIVGVARLAEPSANRRDVGVAAASASGGAASSGMVDVSVFLCTDSSPFKSCRGGEVTAWEKENISRALRARRDVKTVTFEDRRTAFENYRRSETNPRLLKATRAEDMPESFRLKLVPGADPLAVAMAASGLPGVSSVVDEGCLRDNQNRPEEVQRQCDFLVR